MKASLAGQLHGVSANVACGPMDEYGLPGSRVGILEKHLPSRDSYDWSRSCFDEVQGFFGFCAIILAEGSAYSAYAPLNCSFVAPYTSSPSLNPETSGPIASTIPDNLEPRISGKGWSSTFVPG
jgi:hypothetical protein